MTGPDAGDTVAIGPETPPAEAADIVRAWVDENVPPAWRAAVQDGPGAQRAARSREAYTAWYPIFGRSGLVVPAWPREYGGLGVSTDAAAAIERVLAPCRLHRLNPLGLNNMAAALFAFGTEGQRRRFLPPIVRNEERWCQLFSEPGAGSDLASLACRAVLDGDEWVLTGQKVWTTWAHESDYAIVLARTDPDRPKRQGVTYLLLDLRQPGVEIRPLRQITGEAEFNEVFLDGALVPDAQRVGAENEGWKVSAATLSSERQMVSGSGSGGIGRLGGSSAEQILRTARRLGRWVDPVLRQRLVALWIEERIRGWTNARVGASLAAGQAPGPAASIGKVHQATLNQHLQAALVDLLGADATAWAPVGGSREGPEAYAASLRPEINGMLRSRANSIEGGTTEINKNIIGERVLGLPREPDPWHGRPWSEVPRS
jgi:alkylation response protein AidB-like acyl-CoA dehydrogenase